MWFWWNYLPRLWRCQFQHILFSTFFHTKTRQLPDRIFCLDSHTFLEHHAALKCKSVYDVQKSSLNLFLLLWQINTPFFTVWRDANYVPSMRGFCITLPISKASCDNHCDFIWFVFCFLCGAAVMITLSACIWRSLQRCYSYPASASLLCCHLSVCLMWVWLVRFREERERYGRKSALLTKCAR